MILIHKETAEIYEMRIRSFCYTPKHEGPFNNQIEYSIFCSYEIGEIFFVGSEPYGEIKNSEIADHFEILGWL